MHLTSWGQPKAEKGKRAEENHVSRTSGSGKQNRKRRRLEPQLLDPQTTAAHLSSPTPTLTFPTLPLQDPGYLSSLPRLRHSPLSRVSSAPGLPVSSAATSLASASVRPTTQQSSLSPCGTSKGWGMMRKNTLQVGNLTDPQSFMGPSGSEMKNARPASLPTPPSHQAVRVQD